ncbi:MAG: iron complex outermembrane receptor protein [Cognaticolwellia sp.]|jgi:iron complex outermembrane receptor protein
MIHIKKFTSKLSLVASAIALSGLSAMTVTFGAVAEESNADENIERIMVTGSRRNDRTVAESTSPVDIIDIESMSATGQLEVSQILSNLLPSFNYPKAALNDGTDHASPATLRGLAPDHTLVLINGKRRHSGALLNLGGSVGRGSTAVDLNMIPTSAIKNIQVLRDGAAAQYGSDAIAGVINIILKDGDEGGSFAVTYGKYDTEVAGVKEIKSKTIVGNELVFEDGGDIHRSDGETTTIAGDIGLSLGEDGFLHLAFESRDRAPTSRNGYEARQVYNPLVDGSVDPRELDFDHANNFRVGRADIQDLSFVYNLGYSFNNTTELYSFGTYGQRDGDSAAFFRQPKQGRSLGIFPDGFLPHITTDVVDTAIVVGVNGELDEWNWDASIDYGKNDFGLGNENTVNSSLGDNSPTSFYNGALIYDQTIVNLTFDNMLDFGLYDDVFFAIGVEYRKENYEIVAGEEASYIDGGSQGFPGLPASTAQGRNNLGLFIELDTDLTDNLNVALAGRYEDYSDFGTNFTSKLAARYVVNDNLSFRGAISTGFRAPSLAQTSYTTVSTIFVDDGSGGQIPQESGLFPVNTPVAQALGAKELTPEESVNMTLGFVYTQGAFNFTVDAYNIKIDDRIVLSENISGSAVDDILTAADVSGVGSARYFTNAIDTETQGIDVVGTYDLDLNDMGSLVLSAAVNIGDTEVTHLKANPSELNVLGDSYILFSEREIARFESSAPDSKLNLSATWHMDDLKVSLRSTRFGEWRDPQSDGYVEVNDAQWITDLDVAYQVTDNIKLTLGVNNLFDSYPKVANEFLNEDGSERVSTFGRIIPFSPFSPYGVDGRFVYGRISMNF